MCINFSPELLGGGWVGGRWGGQSSPQVNTRGPELPTDGHDHTYNQAKGTSFRSRVEFQADNAQLVRSTSVNESVMVLQGRKSSPQKSKPFESGHRRHAVWIAIEYSYKLGQKNEFKFLCELGWFSQRQSHIAVKLSYLHVSLQN